MKVLWFASTPCGAFGKDGVIQGGWMVSLENEIKKYNDVKLCVAFLHDEDISPFENGGVSYFPICIQEKKSKIGRVLYRFTEDIEIENNKVLKKIAQVVSSYNPDIIHVHGTEGFLGLVYRLKLKIPVVYSIQGLLAPYLEKYYSGIPASFISSHESLFVKLRGLSSALECHKMKIKAKREIEYLKHAQYIIGRTFWDKNIPLFFNPQARYFIGDEILRSPFYHSEWNKTKFGDKLRIVSTISSGPSYKGFETLLQAASIMKKHADFDFEWNVIGYSDNEKWVSLSEKYKKTSCAEVNVKLLGRKTAEEMVEVLLASDVYCHVSHIENSPNSVCEAMLLGMPVVATNGGGTCSMLSHDNEGLLIQDGDPYVMAGAISDIVHHFDKAKTFGQNARMRAFERHNPERIGKALVETYNTIVKDNKNQE